MRRRVGVAASLTPFYIVKDLIMSRHNAHNQLGKLALASDLGAGFSDVCVFQNGQLTQVKFPLDGDQIASAVWYGDDGQTYVGVEALNRAYKDPSRLYMNFKPELYDRPDESVNDGPTRVELTAELVRYIKGQLIKRMPELAEYPQFGGNLRSADSLVLAFTVPACWRIEQQETMKRAIAMAGIKVDSGKLSFISEPKAGALRISREHGSRLFEGCLILVVDAGTGSIDIVVVRFERGVFHEVTAPVGDNFLGGRNFTAAIALEICKRLGLDCEAAFEIDSGLRLQEVEDEEGREVALNIWNAAEEAKIKLSTRNTVSVFVQTADGKREVELTETEAQELWKPLWARMEKTLISGMKNSGVVLSKIDLVFLIGGSAQLPSFAGRLARLSDRKENDILLSMDSAHVISSGAAESAWFGEKTDQAMIAGLGMQVRDRNNEPVNLMLVTPGHIVPADGQELEFMGQAIQSPGGSTTLILEPFIAKPGVRCSDTSLGVPVTLTNSEIIPLKRVQQVIELPSGEHDVRMSVMIDPHRTTNIVFSPVDLPDYEPIVVPLELDGEDEDEPTLVRMDELEIALILDCSKSMAKKGKIKAAKVAIRKFLSQIRKFSPRVALIRMSDDVDVVCPMTADFEMVTQCLSSLEAEGGTWMTESLECGERLLRYGAKGFDKKVIMFSDGWPQCAKSAVEQAQSLKEIAEVFCVGIGSDACPRLLRQIATSPAHYFKANVPDDIFGCLVKVAQVIYKGSGLHD